MDLRAAARWFAGVFGFVAFFAIRPFFTRCGMSVISKVLAPFFSFFAVLHFRLGSMVLEPTVEQKKVALGVVVVVLEAMDLAKALELCSADLAIVARAGLVVVV